MYNEFIQFNEKYFNNISINGKNKASFFITNGGTLRGRGSLYLSLQIIREKIEA